MGDEKQFCTFYVDGQCFGLEVLRVQEILRYQDMTRVPLAAPIVRGLINLRGQIVTAIDLRRRLELPALPPGQLPLNVVVRGDDGPISLLVDEIGDVRDVPESSFELPPETLPEAFRSLIHGAYKLPDCLLLILDPQEIMTPDAGDEAADGRAESQHPSRGNGSLEYLSWDGSST